jgi:hypothetical protein
MRRFRTVEWEAVAGVVAAVVALVLHLLGVADERLAHSERCSSPRFIASAS